MRTILNTSGPVVLVQIERTRGGRADPSRRSSAAIRKGTIVQNFDSELKMFREEAAPVDYARLRFMRWLIEHGRLDYPPAGPPSGPFAEEAAEELLLVGAA